MACMMFAPKNRKNHGSGAILFKTVIAVVTKIALFRGINVGGQGTLPMKELVALLQELGCKNVCTYIQSGNAVFESEEKDSSSLTGRIRSEIKHRRGFEPTVVLLSIEELERTIARNPFSEATNNPQTLHLGFLSALPLNPDLKALESLKSRSERFQLIDKVFYLHAPEGVGRSKLAAAAEKFLGVPMTDRNWRTVCKLAEMATSR